jgi:hypothetical protein
MKRFGYILIILIFLGTIACDNDPFIDDNSRGQTTTGVLEVDFKLPYVPLPEKKIHRINLSIARSADSLYKGLFISSANVSDSKSLYRFVLTPGSYYYQAAITCSCQADSCLWGGFPGGQWGKRWAIDKVDVLLGEVIRESPSFQ